MRAPRLIPVLAAVLALGVVAPAHLAAAEPELVSSTPFAVRAGGGAVDVGFTLTMSEVTSYPVKITAIAGSTEEVLYEGTLSEGVYRLHAPLTTISGSGDLKVVLKTRVTNRSDKGNESYTVYLKWQGSR